MAVLERASELWVETWTPPTGAGLWNWLLQRITGALLIVFIIAHFWVTHFAVPGELITFDRVTERLQSAFFIALDSALLATTIYHGLNGVRNVVVDFGIGPVTRQAVSWTLVVIGLITFVYGLNALVPFITGRPLFPL